MRFGKALRHCDVAGQPLDLRFMRGESHFKTHFGGCLSLLFRVLVLIYAAQKVIHLATKGEPDLHATQKLV